MHQIFSGIAGLLPSLAEEVPKFNIYNSRPYSDRFREILKKRLQLPVWEYRNDFMVTAFKHQVIVLVGETGSGKTTQVIISSFIFVSKARNNQIF